MENASATLLGAGRKSMRKIRSALGAAFVNPVLLTAAEKLQYEGYLRREEINADIVPRAEGGSTIKELMRNTAHSRGLVRKILRGQRADIFRTREISLEPHLPWLESEWAAGSRNGANLWRRLRAPFFPAYLTFKPDDISGTDRYAHYYNNLRTQQSFENDTPISRAVDTFARIDSRPLLDGLHHYYARI